MVERQDRGRAFTGGALLLANGAIHVVAFPDHYKVAPYIGVLFLLLAAATALLAVAIGARIRLAWSSAALLSAVAIVLYILARTTGLPFYHEDDWLDSMGALPLGVLSIVTEGAFLFLYVIWRPRAEHYRRRAF